MNETILSIACGVIVSLFNGTTVSTFGSSSSIMFAIIFMADASVRESTNNTPLQSRYTLETIACGGWWVVKNKTRRCVCVCVLCVCVCVIL